ncbi:hypothetical protein [Paraliomyxa miuraensis]|uniref:hypothetical protein n=1 Tax=Paraliomyxa miuraensis TaxID=376150 RepID=UPI002254D1C7|nr:hypothetical protein [Paraliomyxa miuraensis]MCX4239705.1 hypothetical protein [Paraliomyxa miuraensis]
MAPRDGPSCGNGVVDEGEACDLGFGNGPEGPCRSDCQAPRCGDGVPDEGERCDDGNDDEADACRSDCRRPLQSSWVRAPAGGERPAVALGVAIDPAAADGSAGAVVVGQGQAAAGAPLRAWLLGIAADGETRWSRTLPEDDAWSSATARAVVIDPTGDVWVTGEVHGEDDGDDVWLARCDPEGHPRWSTTLDVWGDRDRGLALALHGDGVVVVGEALREAHDRDGLVLAYDGQGQRRWTWRHDGPAGAIDDARAVAIAPDGGVVVGGGEDDLTAWWLTKLDDTGFPVGVQRTRGELGAWVSAIAIDEGGDLWVAGTEVLAAPEPWDPSTWHAQPWLARLDAAAGLRWRVTEPPPGPMRREALGVALDPAGGAIIIGTDPIPDSPCSSTDCPARPWVAAYDADGAQRYAMSPDEVVRGEGRAIARDPEGQLWLVGSRRVVFQEADAWLGRYREQAPEEGAP